MTYPLCQVATKSQATIAIPRSSPNASSIFGAGFVSRPDRTSPQARVEIEGQDLTKLGFKPLITAVTITDEIGRIPCAEVTIADPDGLYMDHPLWAEGREIRISLGYPTTSLASRGRFLIATPRFDFRETRSVTLVCYGEDLKLTTTERRRQFQNQRDSDMVQQIASENGFTANVDPTEPIFRLVNQVNETDAEFLAQRARLYGYEFYVENGELHFHAPRAETTGIVLNYRGGASSTLGRFSARVSPCYRALSAVLTEVNPLSGEVYEVRSQDSQDEITREGLRASQRPTKTWREIASAYGGGEKFVVGGGHLAQQGARTPEVEALSRSTRWVVEAGGECEGIENLTVRRTLRVLGVGRWSGDYRITRTTHDFDQGYRINFSLARTWTGQTGKESSPISGSPNAATVAGGLSDVSSKSELAGIAVEIA